jgi:hypothetical protein
MGSARAGDERAAELAELGTARFLTPEQLARKIRAVTGIRWDRGWDTSEQLRTDYEVLYGGIDSDLVTERLEEPNGIMAAVALRMANEVSCRATAYDFSRPPAARALFPDIELDTMPLTPEGAADPEGEARVRSAIAQLHARVLGVSVAANGSAGSAGRSGS